MSRWMRTVAIAALGCAAASAASWASAQEPATDAVRIRLFADTDDDDDDGTRDRETNAPEHAADVQWIDSTVERPVQLRSIHGTGIRVIADQTIYTADTLRAAISLQRIGLQGLRPGEAVIDLGSYRVHAAICEFVASDIDGKQVDLVKSHASLSRTLPPKLAKQADGSKDVDALAWTVVCPTGSVPSGVQIESTRSGGELLDAITFARLAPSPCPAGVAPELECGKTALIRATTDVVDRAHPTSAKQSLRAEVGGRIVLQVEGQKASSIRVGGPRNTQLGDAGRYRARLQVYVLRTTPGGPAAIGGNDAGAYELARDEIRTANALWGQCGIVFDADDRPPVRIVDPPPPHLLALGCNLALPASGGGIQVHVNGTPLKIATAAGETPLAVAQHVVEVARAAGYDARLSPNPRISQGALRSADVLFRGKDGQLATLTAGADGLSTDTSLSACIGRVDLSDGLTHFGDLDASAGTLEERTLLKALQDDDPSTIDVFIVPSFSRTGRIGESFIDADRSSVRNAVVVDRAGIRAGARSFALAHELGHILLDMPGHPDDYGVDRPWVLMDADAADPTIFGPRRLPIDDCERAYRQSGPEAPIPLLEAWPLVETGSAPRSATKPFMTLP